MQEPKHLEFGESYNAARVQEAITLLQDSLAYASVPMVRKAIETLQRSKGQGKFSSFLPEIEMFFKSFPSLNGIIIQLEAADEIELIAVGAIDRDESELSLIDTTIDEFSNPIAIEDVLLAWQRWWTIENADICQKFLQKLYRQFGNKQNIIIHNPND